MMLLNVHVGPNKVARLYRPGGTLPSTWCTHGTKGWKRCAVRKRQPICEGWTQPLPKRASLAPDQRRVDACRSGVLNCWRQEGRSRLVRAVWFVMHGKDQEPVLQAPEQE
ncbi:hypothetical protein EC915_10834 [Pseudomonas sp. LP_7_YM]|nr:hypothetical protein EC915_10834 [Pseudomonas sp. LP_7_YM]